VYESRAYEIPEGSRVSKGRAIFNFLSINQQEKITSVLCVPKALKIKKGLKASNSAPLYIFMVTKNGIIKKVEANAFENVRKSGLLALTIKGGDALRWAKLTTGNDELILVTRKGQAIRFSEKDVRAMGRQAAGVISIRLKKEDEVVGAEVITKEMAAAGKILVISENGYGKQTLLKQYKKQKRGGSGIKTAKVTSKIGNIVGAQIINEDVTELITISRKGQVIKTTLATIPVLGRATQGVRVMRLEDDKVASITTL
jgi:DNA gyrase subunit A